MTTKTWRQKYASFGNWHFQFQKVFNQRRRDIFFSMMSFFLSFLTFWTKWNSTPRKLLRPPLLPVQAESSCRYVLIGGAYICSVKSGINYINYSPLPKLKFEIVNKREHTSWYQNVFLHACRAGPGYIFRVNLLIYMGAFTLEGMSHVSFVRNVRKPQDPLGKCKAWNLVWGPGRVQEERPWEGSPGSVRQTWDICA